MRHALAGDLADDVGRDRDVTPAEDGERLLGGDPLDGLNGGGTLGLVDGQEGQADGVCAGAGQREVDHLAEEGVGDLAEDARAVADVRVRTGGAAMVEVAQGGQRVLDDVVAGAAAHRGDHGHPAGVVLVLRAVETDIVRLGREEVARALRGGPGGGCGHVTVLTLLSVSRPTSDFGQMAPAVGWGDTCGRRQVRLGGVGQCGVRISVASSVLYSGTTHSEC